MTDPELDKIIEEKKRKYVPSRSTQLWRGGVIFLVSLAIGLLCFVFEPLPSDVKPEDVGWLRQVFGVWLGLLIAAGGMTFYLVWTLWRGHKAKKEAETELLVAALKRLRKK